MNFYKKDSKGHLTWLVNFRIPLEIPNLFGESAHNEYIFSLAGKNVASTLPYCGDFDRSTSYFRV